MTESPEWLRVTLSSIGDAVITTDSQGKVTFLNPVAETLTGWTNDQATSGGGVALPLVFRIVNQDTHKEVENPALRALREGVIVGLANHTLLIARDGTERPIDDSAAPIRNDKREVAGAVLVFRDITERRRAEAAMAHLAAIVTSSDDAIISKDLRGIIRTWNMGAQRLFGYTAEEAVGKPITIVIPADRRNEEAEILERIGRGEPIDHYETVRQRKDGTFLDISLTVSPLRDAAGHIVGASKVARDITQRKQAAQALSTELDAMTRLHSLSTRLLAATSLDGALDDVLQEAILTSRADFGNIQLHNAKIGALEIVVQRGFRQDFLDHFRTVRIDEGSACAQAMKNGERVIIDDVQADPSYEPHRQIAAAAGYRSVQSTPLKNRSGGVIGMLSTHFRQPHRPSERDQRLLDLYARHAADLIERIRAEQALHDSELRYRRLFQSAKDGILILDANTGKIIDANTFMATLVGLEAHELLGKQLFEIGMFGDESENRAAFKELQERKYIRYDHLPVQHRSGTKVEVEFVSNVYHEDHTLVAQCNVRDISQRLAMEKKITAQAEQLVGESRRKDEFLAMLSHELRNPLAPIRSAVHLLRMEERAGSENIIQKQAHDIIERQVANLTRLVSDLLEVSRVVSGRIRLTLQTVDMNRILEHAIETVRPLIEQRQHALTVSLCGEPIWANADATRMEEVFMNLLNNAAKYTPDGGKIDVHCEQPRGTNYAQVRVRDNGVGIDKELLPRIFDLFTQADRSLARSAGGLGIGLSLAHRIVDLHGGSLEAKSPPDDSDQGTEMIVQLARTHEPVGLEAASSEGDPALMPNARGLRVLVVDDNIDLVMMLSSSLRHVGYSVQSAYTGPDGLKVAQSWRPDIVLLDIGLPGLDGYEVARQLRANPAFKGVRMIALTGYGRDADLAMARDAGFDAHMVKPYEFKELEKLMVSKGI